MKAFYVLSIILFVGFSLFQIHESAPPGWIALYTFPALICLLEMIRSAGYALRKPLIIAGLALYLIVFSIHFPRGFDALQNWFTEGHGREALGALLCFVILAVVWFANPHGRRRKRGHSTGARFSS
jgi:hypothetical protein